MNNLPAVTKNLLIINILCFVGNFVAHSKYGINLNDLLGLHFFLASDFKPFQLITYMFMHADLQHIFFNMFAVWMFGRTLEHVLGAKRFLIYYMACGIGAGLVQEMVQYAEYAFTLSNYDGVNTGLTVSEHDDYGRSLWSRFWYFAGFRHAVSQHSNVCFPLAFPHQGQVFRDWLCSCRIDSWIGCFRRRSCTFCTSRRDDIRILPHYILA